MARPLRIEFDGALYHVTSRGNARRAIFLDDDDRQSFLERLDKVVDRFGWVCHGYCLMVNHFHLLLETPAANLSRGMQLLNGTYTQGFNRCHKRVGHVLQGRFKGILVEKESQLLELARYVVLNPVRAGVVRHPREFPWSSYRATAGEDVPAHFLTTEWILSQFDGNLKRARAAYRRFVMEGLGVSVWENVKGGILLGTEEFVTRMGPMLREAEPDFDIRRRERFADRPSLAEIFSEVSSDRRLRNLGIYEAAFTYGYTLTAISKHLGLHPSTLSRIVKRVGENRHAQGKV
jgi:putative transposase